MSVIKQEYGTIWSDAYYLRSEANVLGAKNLLPTVNNSWTLRGVTYTYNSSDGSYTVDGTNTDTANSYVDMASNFTLPAGEYILSGGISDDIFIYIYASSSLMFQNKGGETKFTLSSSTTFTSNRINVAPGATASNVIIKPMVRLASDPDNTYEPYAMTNKQLTDLTPRCIGVTYTNASSLTVPAGNVNYATAALTTTNTTDLSKYAIVGVSAINIGSQPSGSLAICGYSLSSSQCNIRFNNFTTAEKTLAAGTINMTVRFIKVA